MITSPLKLAMYEAMRRTRMFEEWIDTICHNQTPQNPVIIGKGYLSTGQEAISIGTAFAMQSEDWLAPSHRDIGAHLARGLPMHELLLQYMSRVGSPTHGRDGNVHFGLKKYRTLGFISQMGALTVAANGVAFGMKYRSEKSAVACLYGDGASSQGTVHEALNHAAVFKLPVVFIVNNNRWAISTPVARQMAIENIADRAVGYGMPGEVVDGNDAVAVHEHVALALARARSGAGPSLIECKSMRMAGHGTHDMAKYVPEAEYAHWRKVDPLLRLEKLLRDEGILDDAGLNTMTERLQHELHEQIALAMQAPPIEVQDEEKDVFAV